jgi:hypothetical protein
MFVHLIDRAEGGRCILYIVAGNETFDYLKTAFAEGWSAETSEGCLSEFVSFMGFRMDREDSLCAVLLPKRP